VYRTLDDYDHDLQTLAQGHPGLVRRFELPRRSVYDRPLWGLELASNVNRTDDGRPVFLVFGLHHAREWPSGEVAIEFAFDLAKRYGTDGRVTALLDAVRVIVVPVVNPDGFEVSRSGQVDMQRKNCALTSLDTPDDEACAQREGVDLNRNYGAAWGGPGSGTSPVEETYRGPEPFSEPESRAVHELSQRLQVTTVVSIHNVAALVLRQPGSRELGAVTPDEARMKDLGDAMAAATDYESQHGYELYDVSGATEDWNYIAQGAYGYTLELGPGSSGLFHGDYTTHVADQYLGGGSGVPAGNGAREALLRAAEAAGRRADHAVVTGTGTPGNLLRLRRAFRTETAALCDPDCTARKPPLQLDDFVETTMTVPADGRFEWHVGPSTRPYVRARGATEAWTLTCENAAGAVVGRTDVVVGRGETAQIDACDDDATPVVTRTPSQNTATGSADDATAGGGRHPRLVVGRSRVVRKGRGAQRKRWLVARVVVTGGALRSASAVVRNRHGLTVASRRYRRLSGRQTVRVPLKRWVRVAGLRLSVTGVAADGTVIRAFSARLWAQLASHASHRRT
jgi:hypothetical protein